MESVVKIPYNDHVYIQSALSKHYYSFVHNNPSVDELSLQWLYMSAMHLRSSATRLYIW